MLTGVARTNWAARSNQWNSGRLRIISSTRSPADTRSDKRPCATFDVSSATSAAVHVFQPPPSFIECRSGSPG